MTRIKDDVDDIDEIEYMDDEDDNKTDSKNTKSSRILVYKHSDELFIEWIPNCYTLNTKGRITYYTSLDGAFKALSKALLVEHFGRIPEHEKTDIRRVVEIIEEHDKWIRGLFKGY